MTFTQVTNTKDPRRILRTCIFRTWVLYSCSANNQSWLQPNTNQRLPLGRGCMNFGDEDVQKSMILTRSITRAANAKEHIGAKSETFR